MSGHTPGPWSFNDYGEILCGPEDDQLRIAELAPWEPQHIPEMTANARLIAAAPEMLEALKEAVTNGEWSEGEQCGDWCISKEVYEMLRDAIAKAGSA